jgi:hypothetical protein
MGGFPRLDWQMHGPLASKIRPICAAAAIATELTVFAGVTGNPAHCKPRDLLIRAQHQDRHKMNRIVFVAYVRSMPLLQRLDQHWLP